MQELEFLPGFAADTAGGDQDDLLDIGLDVDAMAALVAARDIQPPLSIGLFGDWGSGKSFFMEKVHARVAHIAREPGSQGPASRPEGERFCRGVVQIRFNAWHYVESNLWASLVHTIFRRLEDAVRGSQDGEARLRVLRERLQHALARRVEVQRELEELDRRLDQARAQRDRAAAEKQQAEEEARSLRVTGLPTISEEMRAQLDSLLREVRDNVGIQGLPEATSATQATIDDAVRMLSDARLLRSRGSQLWQALVHSGLTWRQWLVMGISLVAPVAIAAVVAYLNESSLLDLLSQPLLVLAELAVMIGNAVRWARDKMRQASDVLDRIDALRGQLTIERDQAQSKHDQALARAERQVMRLAEELQRKQGELDRISTEADQVRRQLGELAPIRRMARFLSERASSDDYRKHLGLLALIRRDLDELSKLLAMQDGEQPDAAMPAVDRIVLYIDDLDRCPPQRVVELLQAVHLLLAFPLFVVVVAVDAHWIARSLEEHYPALLDDVPGEGGATSHDYLEKIFQIPFWIRPLTPATGASMIAGLIDRNQQSRDDQQIHARERQVMLALSGCAGRSPRAIKRFVNTYRLLKASLSGSERQGFEPDAQGRGPYQATLLALAILVGYPRVAEALFDALLSRRQDEDETENSTTTWMTALCEQMAKQARFRAVAPDWTDLSRVVSDFCRAHPVSLSELRACIPRVARYSFRHRC